MCVDWERSMGEWLRMQEINIFSPYAVAISLECPFIIVIMKIRMKNCLATWVAAVWLIAMSSLGCSSTQVKPFWIKEKAWKNISLKVLPKGGMIRALHYNSTHSNLSWSQINVHRAAAIMMHWYYIFGLNTNTHQNNLMTTIINPIEGTGQISNEQPGNKLKWI